MNESRYNAAEEFIDKQVSAGFADKTCFIDPNKSITYKELQSASYKMANLLHDAGIERESRIAILALDTVDWPVMFFGAIRAGVIPVALNTLLAADQYAYMLQDSRAKALFVSAALLPVVEPVLKDKSDTLKVFVLDGEAGQHNSFDNALASASDHFEAVDTHRDEVAFWLYSSGSTGLPKGVQHIHTSLMDTAKYYAQDVLGIRSDDVVLSAAKMFFAYGLGNSISFPMSVGATTILWPGRPTPDDMFALMNEHQPSFFYGVPTLYAAMLASPDCTPDKTSAKLRICVSAGEALPADISRNWHDRFQVNILDGVGSTEMLHIFLSNSPEGCVYGTSGCAVPGYELRLVNESNEDVSEGEIGELLVKGSSTSTGYWNQRQKSQQTFQGEWTRTGDKYTRDENFRFTYCGRTDDMFKVSGIWVSPFEVESALVDHDAVLECAVVAYEDSEGLTKPRAFVVLNESGQAIEADQLRESLKEHVKSTIGKWKYPREIEIVDNLPKTATGKIQRFKLRS